MKHLGFKSLASSIVDHGWYWTIDGHIVYVDPSLRKYVLVRFYIADSYKLYLIHPNADLSRFKLVKYKSRSAAVMDVTKWEFSPRHMQSRIPNIHDNGIANVGFSLESMLWKRLLKRMLVCILIIAAILYGLTLI